MSSTEEIQGWRGWCEKYEIKKKIMMWEKKGGSEGKSMREG